MIMPEGLTTAGSIPSMQNMSSVEDAGSGSTYTGFVPCVDQAYAIQGPGYLASLAFLLTTSTTTG